MPEGLPFSCCDFWLMQHQEIQGPTKTNVRNKMMKTARRDPARWLVRAAAFFATGLLRRSAAMTCGGWWMEAAWVLQSAG